MRKTALLAAILASGCTFYSHIGHDPTTLGRPSPAPAAPIPAAFPTPLPAVTPSPSQTPPLCVDTDGVTVIACKSRVK